MLILKDILLQYSKLEKKIIWDDYYNHQTSLVSFDLSIKLTKTWNKCEKYIWETINTYVEHDLTR